MNIFIFNNVSIRNKIYQYELIMNQKWIDF